MQLTAQDKKAAREGFAYVVIRGGKRVCYASTLGEAKRECGKTGRVVSISGMRYAAQNPRKRRNPRTATGYAKVAQQFRKMMVDAYNAWKANMSDPHLWQAYERAERQYQSACVDLYNHSPREQSAYDDDPALQNPFRGSINVRNPSAAAADEIGARELVLYIENDYHLYERRMPEFAKNLATKMKRGSYDADKAVKLLEYLTKEAAIKYGKEFGGTFSPATRRLAAQELLPSVIERAQYEHGTRNPSLNVRNPSLNVRNPSLTAADKRVIAAFTEHRAASSRLLSTDGQRLDGNYMGGSGIATWEGGKIHFHDLGGKTSQTVQRAVAKEAPRNWLARNPSLNVRNPSAAEVGHSVGKYGKYAARGAGRAAKSAWKGTKSFFGSAYSSFKKHNPSLNVR